jgi:uncharacterized protein with PQ loop repeat
MERGHPSKFEQIMVLVGLVSPIATIPQVIKVFATHRQHAAGQSLITWGIYTAISILWVIYGLRRRETPLIIGNALGVIMYGLVAVGILIQAGLTF